MRETRTRAVFALSADATVNLVEGRHGGWIVRSNGVRLVGGRVGQHPAIMYQVISYSVPSRAHTDFCLHLLGALADAATRGVTAVDDDLVWEALAGVLWTATIEEER